MSTCAILLLSVPLHAQRVCLSGCQEGNKVVQRFDPVAAQAIFDSLFYRLDSLTAYVATLGVGSGGSSGSGGSGGSSGTFQCGTSTVTYDGHAYATVQIGTQCWFAENLRNENYADGTPIPGGLDDATWGSTTSGAFTISDEGGANETSNLLTYGRLYNHYAVTAAAGLCPTGWHVPSDAEWTTLETQLGGALVTAGKLKSVSPAWDGNNSSGFSGLPGGGRDDIGSFYNRGNFGFWWSSSLNGGNAIYRYAYNGSANLFTFDFNRPYGFSVRCLQD